MREPMLIFMVAMLFVVYAHEATFASEPEKISLLIIDGQNNHGTWPKTTAMMKKYFEDSGRFEVDVARTAFTSNGGQTGGRNIRFRVLRPLPPKALKRTPTSSPISLPTMWWSPILVTVRRPGPSKHRKILSSMSVTAAVLSSCMPPIILLEIGLNTTR